MAIKGVFLGVLLAGPALAAPFTNGGFESGNFSGWTNTAGSANLVTNGSFTDYRPQRGSYFVVLGTTNTLGFLSQTFDTIAGNLYQVSFYLASNGSGPNQFTASFDGVEFFNQTGIRSQPYTLVTFTGLASTSSTTLTFGGRHDPFYLALDSVEVVNLGLPPSGVPELNLSQVALSFCSIGLILLGSRTRSDADPAAGLGLQSTPG